MGLKIYTANSWWFNAASSLSPPPPVSLCLNSGLSIGDACLIKTCQGFIKSLRGKWYRGGCASPSWQRFHFSSILKSSEWLQLEGWLWLRSSPRPWPCLIDFQRKPGQSLKWCWWLRKLKVGPSSLFDPIKPCMLRCNKVTRSHSTPPEYWAPLLSPGSKKILSLFIYVFFFSYLTPAEQPWAIIWKDLNRSPGNSTFSPPLAASR